MEMDGVGRQASAFDSHTFDVEMSIKVDLPVGSMSISPCGRDVVLASRQGLHIIDLDSPYSPPRHLPHPTPWEVADVQWSPFPSRDYWVISTSNQKAIVWNLAVSTNNAAIDHVLHAHTRAITDINFSPFHPDIAATCAVDSFVHCWDLRNSRRPALSFCEWFAGATQVKWNRQDPHIIASSHDKYLRIWDDRKGAYPLRSIDAHDTKIYGVDWNRTDANKVVTCSLDKTVKFWDYSNLEDVPERILYTDFPVWRARHTPYGHGLLLMPQRDDNDLHLYDQNLHVEGERNACVRPVCKFKSHSDQVKEFLWRSRGSITEEGDNRDFQLISWGMDRQLRLHKVDPKVMEEIGYQKGQKPDARLKLTRKDATYKTFRDETYRLGSSALPAVDLTKPMLLADQTMNSLTHNGTSNHSGTVGAMMKAPNHWTQDGFTTSVSARYGRQPTRKDTNPISWMRGVKIGKKRVDILDRPPRTPITPNRRSMLTSPRTPSSAWEVPESLGDEITHVGEKFKRVRFEDIDMNGRTATLSMNGPWGEGKKSVFLKIHVRFPAEYPEAEPALRLEKMSSVTDETYSKISVELSQITKGFASRRRGCLEALLSYLLGERGLEDSTAWLQEEDDEDTEGNTLTREPDVGDSSSEDEADGTNTIISQSQNLDQTAQIKNVNVPIPRLCGACWSETGKLVCFFPPRSEGDMAPLGRSGQPVNASLAGPIRFENHSQDIVGKKPVGEGTYDNEEGDYSSDSFTSSSGDSSSSGESGHSDLSDHVWFSRRAKDGSKGVRSKYSEKSVNATFLFAMPSEKPKNTVVIHNFSEMLPSKKRLAEEYAIFGEGSDVCNHNALVAERHGELEIAAVWRLAKLLLMNQVPLEIMPQPFRREPVLVVAQRAAQLRQKDSAIDLEYDREVSFLGNLRGRVKWGAHPLGGQMLVASLFDHFEEKADVQMLAMLACVFSEPAAIEGVLRTLMQMPKHDLPMSMKSPAFSLDYYPSKESAISLYRPMLSVTKSGAFYETKATPRTTHGSAGSSNGLWGSDPVSTYSMGITPPRPLATRSADRSDPSSLSASPEMHFLRRSTSISTANANAFSSSLPRAFSSVLGTSPDTKRRLSPVENVFSSFAAGAVTWGTNKIYKDKTLSSTHETIEIESFDDLEETYSDEDSRSTDGGREPAIEFTLHNQDQFDDEGCVTLPLLDPRQTARYNAYRSNYADLLFMWGLQLQRLEVLKFNGLKPFYEDIDTRQNDSDDDNHTSTTPYIDDDAATAKDWQDVILPFASDKQTRMGRNATPSTFAPDAPASGSNAKTEQDSWTGLEVLRSCHSCEKHYFSRGLFSSNEAAMEDSVGTLLASGGPKARKCSTCTSSLQTKLRCSVCLELVTGIYAPCLTCGHVTHSKCHQLWFGGKSMDENADSDDGFRDEVGQEVTCPTGCGCACQQQADGNLSTP
jgi:WD40 repeat protein